MTIPTAATVDAYRPVILRESGDEKALSELMSQPGVQVMDTSAAWRHELTELLPALSPAELAEDGRWVYYPWRRVLVLLPGPGAFPRLRLDRNRNKITAVEQENLSGKCIGVVGLSVGHAIAHTLALEGLCGRLRLADFDTVELSNLNRIPATVLDLGVNKSVVAARRIAELNPYLQVEIFPAGLTEESMAEFFDGLDLVVEECDSLDIKVRVREEARSRGLPVLMETSDRGLFDVERFDDEPDRPLFHGLLGDVEPAALSGLATRDKAPHVMRILQASKLSSRMAASMVEIDRTVSSWPQLGSDVQLGAATVASAVRRWGRGQSLPSGRIRVDLDHVFDTLGAASSVGPAVPAGSDPTADPTPGGGQDHAGGPDHTAGPDLTEEIPDELFDALLHGIRLAPSGGNIQPWSVATDQDGVRVFLVRERTSAMDVQFRGSYVAIGAAGFNAEVAAARHGYQAVLDPLPSGGSDDLALQIGLRPGADPELARLYPAMVRRISNRNLGTKRSLEAMVRADLERAAVAGGAGLVLIDDADRLGQVADVLAESDRIRYLTPLLHGQMMSELKWPGRDRLDLGIDVRTLGLDAADVAKLEVAARPEVMAHLAAWQGGQALGDNTRDRVNACSALAVVTVDGDGALDYLRGGAAVERLWIAAERLGLGVQPVSPVFLYARSRSDLETLSPPFSAELGDLRDSFLRIAGLQGGEAPVLVLRLTHESGATMRSERLPLSEVLAAGR